MINLILLILLVGIILYFGAGLIGFLISLAAGAVVVAIQLAPAVLVVGAIALIIYGVFSLFRGNNGK